MRITSVLYLVIRRILIIIIKKNNRIKITNLSVFIILEYLSEDFLFT